jgi:hypothetical protein
MQRALPFARLMALLVVCGQAACGSGGGASSTPPRDPVDDEPECIDRDGDGFCAYDQVPVDCDDDDPQRNGDVEETCNGRDDDCDGNIDETGGECALSCQTPEGGCEVPTHVVAGARHACAATDRGTVYCWGSNSSGQLGTPELTHSAVPLRVPGLSGVKRLVSDYDGTCALTDSGALCWGSGWSRPRHVAMEAGATDVELSGSGLCAVSSAGELRCTDMSSPGPAKVVADEVLDVASRAGGLCVLRVGGAVHCGTYDGTQTPSVEYESGVTAIFSGIDGTLCAKVDGRLECDRVEVAGNAGAVEIGTGDTLDCARAEDGRVACWEGEAPAITDAVQLAVGSQFACVLRQGGTLGCWGRRNHGALGDGVVSGALAEVLVAPRPGPDRPGLEHAVLGAAMERGACDNPADVHLLGENGTLHASVARCSEECAGRLDRDVCFSGCTQSTVSAACQACFVAFAECKQATGCYDALRECAGFAPEFLSIYQGPPDLQCEEGGCGLTGKPVGAVCDDSSECLSGSCDRHPYASEQNGERICLAADGSRCGEGADHCVCGENASYCGSCDAPGQAAATFNDFSTPDSCFRDCTADENVCSFGQTCNYFGNSSDRYCDY